MNDHLAHLILLGDQADDRGGYAAMWVDIDGSMTDMWVPAGMVAAIDAQRDEQRRLAEACDGLREALLQRNEAKCQ